MGRAMEIYHPFISWLEYLDPAEKDISSRRHCQIFILCLLTLNSSLTNELRRCLIRRVGIAVKRTNNSIKTPLKYSQGLQESC